MTESKKAWVRPELIVLVRSKPEEAVLVVCKSAVSSYNPVFQVGCGWGYAYDCVDNAAS